MSIPRSCDQGCIKRWGDSPVGEPPQNCRKWSRDKPDSVFLGGFDGAPREAIIPLRFELPRTFSDLTRRHHAGRMRLFRAVGASLFDLAPRRVWLISLRRLPQGLPFPAKRSLPRTFFLFHCSSPFGGGPLAPALPYGVRTFLPCPFEGARAIACGSSLGVITYQSRTGLSRWASKPLNSAVISI